MRLGSVIAVAVAAALIRSTACEPPAGKKKKMGATANHPITTRMGRRRLGISSKERKKDGFIVSLGIKYMIWFILSDWFYLYLDRFTKLIKFYS